jgi:hypothetical protein
LKASYASTRVGDNTFATTLSNQDNQNRTNGVPFGRNYRVIHVNDVVPLGPFRSSGYAHTLPFYNITKPITAPRTMPAALPPLPPPVALGDVVLSNGPDVDVNNRDLINIIRRASRQQIKYDHIYYFTWISKCLDANVRALGTGEAGTLTANATAEPLVATFPGEALMLYDFVQEFFRVRS